MFMFHVEQIQPTGKESPMSSTIQKPKSRLGRGLSSLLAVSDLPVEAEILPPAQPAAASDNVLPVSDTPGEIAVDQVTPNPHQPRRVMNDASIVELAASLKSTG